MAARHCPRRSFLSAVGLSAASLGAAQAASRGRRARRHPNVVLIFADDQRFDTIRALGNEQIVTPNLDRLAREGTAFTNAYMMGGMVGATCVPSRAMLLSGRSLFRLQGNGNVIPREHTMLPEALNNAGYATYHVGKTHNDRESLARSFTGGATIFGWGGYLKDHFRMPIHDFDPTGKYARQDAYLAGGPDGSAHIPVSNDAPRGLHSSELFSNAAIRLISEHERDEPFFLYLAYHAPHDPREAPKQYHDMYDPDAIALPPNFLPEHPFDNGELKVRDEQLAPWPRTPEVIRRHIADYYAAITHTDAQIGRVLDALEQTGHAENTIVVFAGDSGLAIGQHGLMGKQNLYEGGGIHVPLLLRGPGVPRGKRRDGLCYLFDVFPTLCELCDVPAPPSVEGRSLVPTMGDRRRTPREALYFAYRDFQRAVRDNRHKLIEYVVEGKRTTQLFDLQADPWEINNLAADPAHGETLQRLQGELLRLRDEMGDGDDAFWDGYNDEEKA
jgi:arylsulfatase A-like enzyme